MILKIYRGEKHIGKIGSNGGGQAGRWVERILLMISVSGSNGRQQKYIHSITNPDNKINEHNTYMHPNEHSLTPNFLSTTE